MNRPVFFGEYFVQHLGCFFKLDLLLFVECVLHFVWRFVSDGSVQSLIVVPMHPFQGFPFDLAGGFPWAEVFDDFGLEQSDDASDRHVDAGFGQPFGATNGQTKHAPVRVMDQVALRGLPSADGLVEGVEHEAGCH